MPKGPHEWRRVFELYDLAADVPPDQRDTWLDDACRTDSADIRAAVRQMLADQNDGNDTLLRSASASVRHELESLIDADAPEGDSTRLGPWRLIKEIGRGGMGIVYLADRADGTFEQRAAVKRIRMGLDTDEVLARFLRERQILARLQHPGIARLIDGGADDRGRPYFVMEYVDGEPITAYCNRRSLTVDQRVTLFLAACRAVEFAHRTLVIHRDLKPSNILVTGEGELKLLDFGIAKVLSGEADDAVDRTQTAMPALTPAYASPEQVRGEPATTATDVYGLGGVLYELLTDRRAHDVPDTSPLAYVREILERDPAPPSAMVSGVTRRRLRGDLDAVVLTALRREPDARYGSVGALCDDLERYLKGVPVQARRAPLMLRARKFVARHRIGVAATAVLAIAVTVGVSATIWQARQTARAAARTQAVTTFLTSIFQESDPSAARGATITARELLDRGAARVERELVDQPDVQAEMFRVIGELYRQLGLLDQAGPLLERAVAVATAVSGADSREVAAALDRWGVLLWDRGEYPQAASTLERALAIRRKVHGAQSEEVSATLGALASVYSDLGRDEEAEALHRETYQIDRALYGDESLVSATSAANLAIKLEERGAIEEAKALHRRVLDVRRRLGGPDHPDVAESLLALGVLLSKNGEYDEAERCLREALASSQRVLGPAHHKVAHIMDNLATLLEHRGALSEAVATAREALEVRRRVLPAGHPDLGLSINNFATLSFRLGFFGDAERGFREALDLFTRTLGPDHNYTSTSMANLALAVRERGALADAETLARRALAIRRATRGEESPEVAQSLRHVGLILTDRRAFGEAGRVLDRSVALSRRAYPPAHPRLAEALVTWGRLRLEEDQPRAAEPAFREALDIRLAKIGPDAWQTAEARMYLGMATCAAESADDALALIRAAGASFQAQPELPRWRLAEARAFEGACLVRLGRRDEGRRLTDDSLTIVQTDLGTHHYLTEAIRRQFARAATAAR